MTQDFEDKYLPDCQDYPDIAGEILPLGTFYQYVSSSFVNGFLSCAKSTLKAFLIHRYGKEEENIKNACDFNSSNHVHAELGLLGDDILLLSKSEHGEYWFFWLDCDVSDCCIGRFKTDDLQEVVIESFIEYVKDRQKAMGNPNSEKPPLELDISKLCGWIKF